MSDGGILAQREKALEDLFFEKENRRLVEKLRQERESEGLREGLSAMSGIQDEALLDRLISLDIRPETWAAISLIPLLEVAWSEGHPDPKKRKALLSAAEANGIRVGSAAYELIDHWLAERPPGKFLEVWGASVVDVCAHLSPAEVAGIKREVMARAKRIAEVSGGILGIGSISAAERRVLDEIAKAFP